MVVGGGSGLVGLELGWAGLIWSDWKGGVGCGMFGRRGWVDGWLIGNKGASIYTRYMPSLL